MRKARGRRYRGGWRGMGGLHTPSMMLKIRGRRGILEVDAVDAVFSQTISRVDYRDWEILGLTAAEATQGKEQGKGLTTAWPYVCTSSPRLVWPHQVK